MGNNMATGVEARAENFIHTQVPHLRIIPNERDKAEAPANITFAEEKFIPKKNFDSEIEQRMKKSLETKKGRGYNVLAETDIISDFLEPNNDGILEPTHQAKEYALENITTALSESVMDKKGGSVWVGYRPYIDPEKGFQAFGLPFISLYDAGIADIKQKMVGHPEDIFELGRRFAEKADELFIQEKKEVDHLENGIYGFISGDPGKKFGDPISEKNKATLGYIGITKIRWEVFIGGVRQTVEISVGKGSLKIFQKLIEPLVPHAASITNSIHLLATPINFGDSSNYLDKITDFVRRYDSLLEEDEGNGVLYFCGNQVENPQAKDYQHLMERQKRARVECGSIISSIYETDLELARSLKTGRSTPQIKELLKYWQDVTDKDGNKILGNDELEELTSDLISGHLSRESASILKKYTLVRMWTVAAVILNKDKAAEFLKPQQIRHIETMVENTVDWNSNFYQLSELDKMIAAVQHDWRPCPGGGVISIGTGGINSLLTGFDLVGQVFGIELGSKDPDYCKNCGACGRPLRRVVRRGQSCPYPDCQQVRRC